VPFSDPYEILLTFESLDKIPICAIQKKAIEQSFFVVQFIMSTVNENLENNHFELWGIEQYIPVTDKCCFVSLKGGFNFW